MATLNEEEGGGGDVGSTSNSTTQIAKPDKPMKGDKMMKRQDRTKLEEWTLEMMVRQVKGTLS
ncbi:hypothetical protein CPT_Mendera_052 [Stenotrophomonas phage Mendera]|uniref:Uncharacterized protein n=1 Tax=Stenotrophomonas phage Mendera TaxID=2650877 RepID=A0A5P8PIP8_9CAUD|nr:hypothetical protein HWC60_gp052 [Stenotrophomonas phage Mendera]QFR56601.1 hypothetical protein CPT_Mendera_052 [Stenotrophomonas phage Mendera]